MLSLQQGAGNAAVSRMVLARQVPPVAPPAPAAVHHTKAELDAMTLTDFDAYATDQADWATEPNRPAATPAMPEDYKRKLRRLLIAGFRLLFVLGDVLLVILHGSVDEPLHWSRLLNFFGTFHSGSTS